MWGRDEGGDERDDEGEGGGEGNWVGAYHPIPVLIGEKGEDKKQDHPD